jgi:hypothetical protein
VTVVKGRRKDDEAADKRGHSARGSERARERAADGWGRFASEREAGAERAGARARKQAGDGPREEECGREGEEAAGLGWEKAQQGGRRVFLFFFLFSKSYFPFCIFFF